MKPVTVETVRARIEQIERAINTMPGGFTLSINHEFERACLRELLALLEVKGVTVKLSLDSLPKTEGFWSAIYDMTYQTNRKPHENWNVSLAFSEAKEIAEWLNEIMPFRPTADIEVENAQ